MARKGIPPPLRGAVWPILSGARRLRVDGEYEVRLLPLLPPLPLLFSQRLWSTQPAGFTSEQISRDIHRTFPLHPLLGSPNGQEKLRRILTAFSVRVTEISYTSGMSFMAGILLMTMGEEDAFWTLAAFFLNYGLRGFFTEGLPLLTQSISHLEHLTQVLEPQLHQHFVRSAPLPLLPLLILLAQSALGLSAPIFAATWLQSLFSYDSDTFVWRVWDVFLVDGFSIFLRVSLAILRESRDLLSSKTDFAEILDYLRNTPRRITAPDLLLEAAFKISQDKLLSGCPLPLREVLGPGPRPRGRSRSGSGAAAQALPVPLARGAHGRRARQGGRARGRALVGRAA